VSILSRYTVKEILSHVVGVMAVVLGIFLIRRFGTLLQDAADGSLPLPVILHLLSLRTIMALPSLLPAILYLSVLLGLGRLYRDEEMTALAACGVAPLQVRKAVLGFSLIAAMAVGALSFSARPWAAGRFEDVKTRASVALDMESMSPGRFYEITSEGEQVVFAEGRSAGDQRVMEHVFVQQRQDDRVSILVAERAVEHRDESGEHRILRLLNGHRYDIGSLGADYQITRYKELVIRSAIRTTMPDEGQERVRGTLALIRSTDPKDTGEFQWRLAMPASTFLLVMLAIPLSRIDPKQGKYAKLLVAIVIYTVYRHLLGVAKNWVAEGTLAPLPGIWAVHGLCFAAVAVLFARERRGDA
jgi:lipopolysaccharide export system permease protein